MVLDPHSDSHWPKMRDPDPHWKHFRSETLEEFRIDWVPSTSLKRNTFLTRLNIRVRKCIKNISINILVRKIIRNISFKFLKLYCCRKRNVCYKTKRDYDAYRQNLCLYERKQRFQENVYYPYSSINKIKDNIAHMALFRSITQTSGISRSSCRYLSHNVAWRCCLYFGGKNPYLARTLQMGNCL